jgi:adenosine/AMP kinase
MDQNRFDAMHEKLNSIKEIVVGVENFTHKQTELFEVLNAKFPHIEQFSIALRDANELLMFVENIQIYANDCIEHLKKMKEACEAEIQKQMMIKDMNKMLNKVSSELYDIDELDVIKKELDLLLLKIGRN